MIIEEGEDGGVKRQPEPPTSPAQLHVPSETQPLLAGPSYAHAPPPNYQTALTSPVVHPQHHEHPQLFPEQQTLIDKRDTAERRFVRAFAVAVLVWLLLASLVKSILNLAHLNYYIGVPTKPSPKDGRVVQCFGHATGSQAARWLSTKGPRPSEQSALPKYISQMHIEVPTDAAHYLFTEGSLAYGRVIIDTERRTNTSTMKVTVEARYYSRASFQESDLCVLERDGGAQRGIGIYTPSYAFGKFPADRQLEYTITYTIPASLSTSFLPTNIPAFQSELPNFSYSVLPLHNRVAFNRFDIQGTNGRISIESLDASYVVLKTSNADISINSVSSNITVLAETTNANIELLDAQMTNTDTFRPAAIVVQTTNGRVLVSAQLAWKPRWPTSERSPHGALGIAGFSSNGRLDIAVRQAPAGAKLEIAGRTSNAHAQLMMFPTFEGDVLLRTTNAPRPVVEIADNLGYSHPMYGANRRYSAIERRAGVGGEMQWRGQLGWGTYEHELTPSWWGVVDMMTSNGECALRVPCASAGCMMGAPVIFTSLNQSTA